MVLDRVVGEAIAFAATIVLARLIAPAEFGVVAIALIFHTLARLLTHQGIASALVQRREITPEHGQVAMLLAIAAGALGTAVVYLAAPLLAGVLGERVVEMTRLVSPVFLLAGLTAVPSAMLQRRLDFRALAVVEMLVMVFGTTLTVGLAIAGLDAEALVLGVLGRSVVAALLYLRLARPPLPRWRSGPAREILGFGVPTAAGSLGYQGFRNVDYAIVGASLGMAQLGFYWRAYQLAFEYQAKLTSVMQRMAFPVFSRSRDLADMRSLRFRILRVHSAVIFPCLFLFIATAPDLVPWLYGDAWRPAVVPGQILAVAAFAAPMTAGIGALVLAAGRPRRLAATTWGAAVAYAIVLLLAAPHGIITVCWAVLAYQAVKFVVLHHLLTYKVIGLRLRDLRAEVVPALLSGFALLIIAAGTRAALEAAQAPAPVRLAAAVALGGGAYLAVLRRGFPDTWADLALLGQRALPGRLTVRRRAWARPALRRAA